MDRKSARFIAQDLLKKTSEIYDIWERMGVVYKDKFGDWSLTELGKTLGGKMSKGSALSVPTFEKDIIIEAMRRFLK